MNRLQSHENGSNSPKFSVNSPAINRKFVKISSHFHKISLRFPNYQTGSEGFHASVIFAWLSSTPLQLNVEECTNKGRIDMSVETYEIIYLIEFKVDIPQEEALAQIRSRGYAEKYQTRGKRILPIGIGFSSEEKNVTEFVWEEKSENVAPIIVKNSIP